MFVVSAHKPSFSSFNKPFGRNRLETKNSLLWKMSDLHEYLSGKGRRKTNARKRGWRWKRRKAQSLKRKAYLTVKVGQYICSPVDAPSLPQTCP